MRSRARLWWTGVVSVAVTVTTVAASVWVAGPSAPSPDLARPASAPVAAPGPHALAVLRRWDRRRAEAWAAGDRSALAALYAVGSRTGRRDVRDLERWRHRGLRVTGLHQQVAAVSLRRRTPGRLVLMVIDRTVDGVAVGGPHRLALPRSAWLTHRVMLRRVGGTWVVDEARLGPPDVRHR